MKIQMIGLNQTHADNDMNNALVTSNDMDDKVHHYKVHLQS